MSISLQPGEWATVLVSASGADTLTLATVDFDVTAGATPDRTNASIFTAPGTYRLNSVGEEEVDFYPAIAFNVGPAIGFGVHTEDILPSGSTTRGIAVALASNAPTTIDLTLTPGHGVALGEFTIMRGSGALMSGVSWPKPPDVEILHIEGPSGGWLQAGVSLAPTGRPAALVIEAKNGAQTYTCQLETTGATKGGLAIDLMPTTGSTTLVVANTDTSAVTSAILMWMPNPFHDSRSAMSFEYTMAGCTSPPTASRYVGPLPAG